jgi:molybdenum cofactor guanylyltransferase
MMAMPDHRPRLITMVELLGVVLCGGESSRMGRDKGLLIDSGKPWAEHAADLLKSVCARVVYSITEKQHFVYASTIRGAEFVTDTFLNLGPLGGLLSVHVKFPASDILLLACDLTSVSSADIHPLIDAQGGIRAYKMGDLFEPLCTYYTAAALTEMQERLGPQRLGLQRLLHEMPVTALMPAAPARLQSQNTP